MGKRALPPPPSTVGGYLLAAVGHHTRSGAIWQELAVTAFSIYIFRLHLHELTADRFLLYSAVLGLILGGMVAYRRSIMCRSESSYVDVSLVDKRQPMVFGEMLACTILAGGLLVLTAVVALLMAPAMPASAGALLLGLLLVLLVTFTAVAISFMLSGLVLPSDMPSVLSVVIIVLGASRSDLVTEITRVIDFSPLVFLARVLTPPFEEVIKCAMHSTIAKDWPFILQNIFYTALVIYIAAWIVERQERAVASGSEGRAREGKKEQHA